MRRTSRVEKPVGTYYSAKFKGRFSGSEGRKGEFEHEGDGKREWHLPCRDGYLTIEFALILHRLKFIDGMLRRLLRPRPRVRLEIRKFSRTVWWT